MLERYGYMGGSQKRVEGSMSPVGQREGTGLRLW